MSGSDMSGIEKRWVRVSDVGFMRVILGLGVPEPITKINSVLVNW